MASWGPKLYQDDIANDIKNYYIDQLKLGKTNIEVTNELIDRYQEEISDIDDASVFWFVLADLQWDLGNLLPNVKESALKFLSEGSNLRRWQEENQKEAKIRKKILEDLEQKLKSPMPFEIKISEHKLYKCEWRIGDVYAFKLESDYSKEKGLSDYFLLIQKVDEYIWHPGHIIPVVYWRIIDHFPLSKKDVENSVYIINSIYDGATYRRKMVSTSKRIIPKKLIFIGSFPYLKLPDNELIREDKISISSCHWNLFEENAINDYLMFNSK